MFRRLRILSSSSRQIAVRSGRGSMIRRSCVSSSASSILAVSCGESFRSAHSIPGLPKNANIRMYAGIAANGARRIDFDRPDAPDGVLRYRRRSYIPTVPSIFPGGGAGKRNKGGGGTGPVSRSKARAFYSNAPERVLLSFAPVILPKRLLRLSESRRWRRGKRQLSKSFPVRR